MFLNTVKVNLKTKRSFELRNQNLENLRMKHGFFFPILLLYLVILFYSWRKNLVKLKQNQKGLQHWWIYVLNVNS